MHSKKLLIRLVWIILFIFLLNFLAMQFYWYSSLWYLDMLMHFLGGVWLGLAFLWLFKPRELSAEISNNLSNSLIVKIILSVLVVGIFWEIFEIGISKTITGNTFNILDTSSDIFFDLAGGLFAIFYFLKRVMSNPENTL